jgi:hypothetical protein
MNISNDPFVITIKMKTLFLIEFYCFISLMLRKEYSFILLLILNFVNLILIADSRACYGLKLLRNPNYNHVSIGNRFLASKLS